MTEPNISSITADRFEELAHRLRDGERLGVVFLVLDPDQAPEDVTLNWCCHGAEQEARLREILLRLPSLVAPSTPSPSSLPREEGLSHHHD